MEALVESFPFAFGVLLGATVARLVGVASRSVWIAGSVALGAFATLCSGEYRVSWLYFLFDIGLVGSVSAAVAVLLRQRRRRRPPQA